MTNQEKLEKKINDQNNYYSVIVDGNNHPEQTMPIKTKKEIITIKKCQELTKKIKETFGIQKIQKLKLYMYEYDYSTITANDIPYLESGDIGLTELTDKYAIYFPETNCLQIWENRLPVYENNDGMICRDRDALADCLC